jgi:hypothetical protein
VVLSVAIFVAVAAVGLMSLSACVRAVGRLQLEAEAADLAVTVLSEVQMGVLEATDTGPESFDPPQDDWTWQIVIQELDVARDVAPMRRVEVVIAHPGRGFVYRLAGLLPTETGPLAAAPAQGPPRGA